MRGAARSSAPTGCDVILCVIDELAYFSVTIGTKDEQDEFRTLVRDLVARGRAAGIIVIAATQRPSADIIPTSLRDLFGYRVAFRCTTDSSSDIILSVGWAKEGYSRQEHPPRRPRGRLAARRRRNPPPVQGRLPQRRPDPGRHRRRARDDPAEPVRLPKPAA